MWGRKIEVARTFIFPKRTTGKNYVTYAKINGELKNIALLDSIETKIYLDNFKFTKDEERFFNNCVQNVYTPKTAL
jgi:hypothetical protein